MSLSRSHLCGFFNYHFFFIIFLCFLAPSTITRCVQMRCDFFSGSIVVFLINTCDWLCLLYWDVCWSLITHFFSSPLVLVVANDGTLNFSLSRLSGWVHHHWSFGQHRPDTCFMGQEFFLLLSCLLSSWCANLSVDRSLSFLFLCLCLSTCSQRPPAPKVVQ